MYEASFRLRGKTYDYKIQYEAIKKFMVLPKPDDLHFMLCIGLDPPLRQGQTRYPFLVMQAKKDEEVTIELNLTEEQIAANYKDKLQPHYEQPLHQVITYIFKGLAGKKILSPAKDFQTHRNQFGIKCFIKASEGFLYCLEKAFMFVPKPATYISYDQTQSITFSRVGGAVSALSTFDITVHMKSGGGSNQFSNINREDLKALEDFFKLKGLRVKNEIDEDANMLAAAMRAETMDDSEEEVVGPKADRGSADEDEESVDEDFNAESDSDVAEEFDSAHESSGSGSAESDVDSDAGADEDEEMLDGDEDGEASKTPPKVSDEPLEHFLCDPAGSPRVRGMTADQMLAEEAKEMRSLPRHCTDTSVEHGVSRVLTARIMAFRKGPRPAYHRLKPPLTSQWCADGFVVVATGRRPATIGHQERSGRDWEFSMGKITPVFVDSPPLVGVEGGEGM